MDLITLAVLLATWAAVALTARTVPNEDASRLTLMSVQQLIEQINFDAEDGRFNTAYSVEYDRRRQQMNRK